MSVSAQVDVSLGTFRLRLALEVANGTALALVGPNGAGKTTLLRALAGLVRLGAGRVAIDGIVVEDPSKGVRLAPEERRLGVVFQEPRLFDHLSALDNVAFGLRARGVRRGEARTTASAWLERVGLPEVARLRPRQLSGGQAQRVALARALATQPALLLLDEPLAAVDASARAELRHLLRQELARYTGCRIVVTHDPIEAAALAERLVVIEDGRVSQQGPLAEVTARPRSSWVADMVGLNLFPGQAKGTTVRLDAGALVTTATALEGPVFVAFRPNAVTLHRRRPEGSARNVWGGAVAELNPVGDRARVRVKGELALVAEVTAGAVAELALADHGPVWASVKATDMEVYPA
ncbi:MAG TPA: ABC transporter ATP-binding protein [Acidimicrobiales bacterium]|nr:ABC transporter ATP-binding protein [Acidimicrobiales bacterium]